MVSKLITVTSFSSAIGHILHVSFSRLLTQFKITSSALLLLLHLPCKTHSLHITGCLETWGHSKTGMFDAVSLT